MLFSIDRTEITGSSSGTGENWAQTFGYWDVPGKWDVDQKPDHGASCFEFKWNDHISNVTSKAAKRLYLLRQLNRAGICASDLVLFYFSTIRSVLEYACQVFHFSLPSYLSEELECIQKSALRIIFPYASYDSALKEAGIPSLYDRRASLSFDLFNDIVHDNNHKLAGLLPPKADHHRQLRSNRKFNVPASKTER